MRLSQLFLRTLREAPADAETASHQLLVRGGYIAPLIAGVYSLLPLGLRVQHKLEHIIREEMDAAGGQEVLLPVLQPIELWQETGRDVAWRPPLFRTNDLRQRTLVLAPTHEEAIIDVVRRTVRSHRDLPRRLYQIQSKFRNEERVRGGLLRVREFTMKDLYSFDLDEAGMDAAFDAMDGAYRRIFGRAGLRTIAVEADSGAIGGKESREFMLLAPNGDNEIVHCPVCGYAANAEKAEFARAAAEDVAMLPLAPVATPGVGTIEQLTRFLQVGADHTLKAVFYVCDGELAFVGIRGDLDVNEVKLGHLLKCVELRMAQAHELAARGLLAGSASPVGLSGCTVVVDESVVRARNLVAGGNRPAVHLRNVNYGRDFVADVVADIAAARAGERCVRCGGELAVARGLEVGHIFKLGVQYSEQMHARYFDATGTERPIWMGCYGIGAGRAMACAVEQHHDPRGIMWPATIAPYQVQLVGLGLAERTALDAADSLYQQLQERHIEVLYDDRAEHVSAGVKFNDADLLGMPLRVTVGPRMLAKDAVGLKRRRERVERLVPLGEAAEAIAAEVRALLAEAIVSGEPTVLETGV